MTLKTPCDSTQRESNCILNGAGCGGPGARGPPLFLGRGPGARRGKRGESKKQGPGFAFQKKKIDVGIEHQTTRLKSGLLTNEPNRYRHTREFLNYIKPNNNKKRLHTCSRGLGVRGLLEGGARGSDVRVGPPQPAP